VVSKDHILIHSTGRVKGNLQYKEIEIARGGQFAGNMTQKN
jgi:cytoskeletal protein CcmA (bactofilin family)